MVMEYGNLRDNRANAATSGGTKAACMNMGNQFRPLKEVDKYGRVNPFQDPSRGVIAKKTYTTANPATTTTSITVADYKERNILLNLSGKDSIIGRGIAVFNRLQPATVTNPVTYLIGTNAVGCCVIGLDVPPTVSVNHHHHYGYGGYSAPTYSGHGYSAPAPAPKPSYGHGHGYSSAPSGYSSAPSGYTTAATTASTHKHDEGHGYGIGNHSHGASGYGGYQAGSHSHGSTTHSHEVGAAGASAGGKDFFGGSKSFFGNMAYKSTPRYSSRRSYGY